MTGNDKYRVGVIGAGRQGTIEARAFALHPSTEVVSAADTDPENLALFRRRFGVSGYGSYEKMLETEHLDIALAVLPVKANPDAVVASARAGVKAVFCEKPLAGSLADADRMVEECRDRGVHLGAGLMVSSHPDYRKAYKLVAGGEIGVVHRINLYEANKQGGCHGLNLARRFAQADADWVVGWVEGDPFSDYEEDYEEGNTWFGKIAGYVRFSNGIECFSGFPDIAWRGIEVVGSQGVIHNSNNTAIGLHLLKAPGSGQAAMAGGLTEVEGLFQEYTGEPAQYDEDGWKYPGDTMMAIVQNIVDSLDTGAPLEITTGDDLRHALELAIALRESHRKGHAPVRLPLEDRSLRLYPERWRWHYKKDLYGSEWYMQQLAQHTKR